MDHVVHQGNVYVPYEYGLEAEFETDVIRFASSIFGPKAVYIDVKKRIGQDNILTIPDGYLIDFSFESDPKLYIIENELAVHDPYRHIGQQLLKFAISYKASGRVIKAFLLDHILKQEKGRRLVEEGLAKAGYRNIDDLLDGLIFDKPVIAVVIIDQITSDLENVLRQLAMKTDIIEFQKFVCGSDVIHKFTPFQQEVRDVVGSGEPKIDPDEWDTIVVPANEEGFKEVFLGENCWYQIRMSSSMIDRIKYIAAYQTLPISAITHIADIARIEKYKDTNYYIVYFKDKAREITAIPLPEGKKRGVAPQGPRYTSLKSLKKASTLSDLW